MEKANTYYIQALQIKQLGVVGSESTKKHFLGTTILLDPNTVTDEFGTLRQVSGSDEHENPAQAVHGALQKATSDLIPDAKPAIFLDSTIFRTVPMKGYRADVRFLYNDEEVIESGMHPTDPLSAQLAAVVRAHHNFYQE